MSSLNIRESERKLRGKESSSLTREQRIEARLYGIEQNLKELRKMNVELLITINNKVRSN